MKNRRLLSFFAMALGGFLGARALSDNVIYRKEPVDWVLACFAGAALGLLVSCLFSFLWREKDLDSE